MTDNDSTKNLPDNLSDRQILLELRQVVGVLVERVTELEKRTNPLPPNYDARFAALEDVIKGYDARFVALEESVKGHDAHFAGLDARFAALEDAVKRSNRDMNWNLRGIREDLERERMRHFEYEDRLDVLEKRAA